MPRNVLFHLENLQLNHFPPEQFSLTVHQGEMIALEGHNGAGKSTLLRYLAGLEPSTDGTFFHSETPIKTAMVFQRPEDNLVFSSLQEDVQFGWKNLGLDFNEDRFRELVSMFQLETAGEKNYLEMSRGELERAACASIFSQQPDLLLLDEPLAMQETSIRNGILAALFQQARTLGITILMASHISSQLEAADRIIHLSGESENNGSQNDLSPLRTLIHTANLKETSKQILPETQNLSLTEYRPENAAAPATPCLHGNSISFGYGEKELFNNLSFSLHPGSLYHLQGPSSSGKSVLLMLMAGLLRVQSGEIALLGELFPHAGRQGWDRIGKRDHQKYLNQIRKHLGYAGQHADRQLFSATIWEDTAFGPANFGVSGEALKACQEKALRRMGISETLWQRSPQHLSNGERRKAALAGVIAHEPDILLLDAPYAELDQDGIRCLNNIIYEYLDSGRTVVIAGGE